MFDKIVNPKTGKKVLTNSKLGRAVLNKYLKESGGVDIVGGAAPEITRSR